MGESRFDEASYRIGPVTVEIEDLIATVTLDRPPVNAVDRDALVAIRDAFGSLNDRKDVRAAVFVGAGTRAFIGGADLTSYANRDGDEPAGELIDLGRVARESLWAVTDCAVPVVTAVNGPAIGAGVAFAACSDIIVAAETAYFAALEINVGLLGASAQLSLLVGRHKAREMYFLGDKVPAAEMQRLGAVRSVVPADDVLAEARGVAAAIAEKSPIAMRLAKEAMNRVEFLPLKDAYRLEQDYTNRLLTYEDSDEARKAFLEKRTPEWQWR